MSAISIVGLLGLPAEAVIDLARQFAHLFGQPGQVGERIEITFLELADPGVDTVLTGGEGHGGRQASGIGRQSSRSSCSTRPDA